MGINDSKINRLKSGFIKKYGTIESLALTFASFTQSWSKELSSKLALNGNKS